MKFFHFGTAATLLLLVLSQNLSAQKSNLQVSRCSGVNKTLPVRNIHVDSDNAKWVANTRVTQVRACDLGTPLAVEAGQTTAFAYFGGNADVRWTEEALTAQAKAPVTVTTAFYDAAKDLLWLGTKEAGVLQLKTKPALTLVDRFNTANSKLRSNEINIVFQDKTGRLWIGTRDGLMTGTPGKWKAELQGYDVQRVREFGADVYVLADGEFWVVERGEKFKAFAIPDAAVESDPIDFDLDADGKLWMLSAIATRLDLLTDEYETYSGPEDYTSQFGRCIAIDLDGAVWIGTNDKGLYVIDKASSFTVNILTEKDLTCAGNGRDAALRVKVSGGKAPFTYAWSATGLTGEAPQNLAPGAYTVTVTDASGKTKSAKVTLADPKVTVTATAKQAESGPGKADGQAEAKAEGGDENFSYRWDNGETTMAAKKLAEGPHRVTITDGKGCSATATVSITQKAATLEVTLAEADKIKCNNATTSLKATVSGGKTPYQYAWSNPAFKGEQATNVQRGEYQITVTDAAGVTATTSLKITDPDLLTVTVAVQAPASTGNADGKAAAQARGGTPPYTYQWDNGETAATATKLPPGDRMLKITDANGCNAGFTFKISENILPLSAAIEPGGEIQCPGGKVDLQVVVNGGKAPYRYAWSAPVLSGAQATGVAAGNYQVTVTDATGTTQTAVTTVKTPDPIIASTAAQAPASTGNANGKAIATGKGGNGNFSYRWDNGETTATATKLAPGSHSVTITDAKGCTATAAVEITENILPLGVTVEESGKIKCAGDKTTLQATVAGGKGPFKFAWSNPALTGEQPTGVAAGNYQLTVTDATGSTAGATFLVKEPAAVSASAQVQKSASTGNADGKATASAQGGSGNFTFKWDNGETAAAAVKLVPGSHTVTVTDANGCNATTTVEITENILPLSVVVEETGKIKCAGDKTALQVNVAGGKGPFKFAWNNPAVTGEKPTGVTAGDYVVSVTDAAGTQVATKFTVVQPAPLNLIATVQTPASTGNADGKAIAQPRGGSGDNIFAWDNGESTATAVRLGPGRHTVTVTDANGCSATASFDISENILPLALALEAGDKIKCAGGTTSLQATISGGKGPFQYRWSDAALSGGNPTGVKAGDYQLTITDAQGASQTASISVKAPAGLDVEVLRNVGATTDRSNDGRAALKIKGGTGTPTLAWDNGETTLEAKKLGLGTHTVTITDGSGCTSTATVETKQRILPELTVGQLQNGQTIRMEQLRFKADSSSLNADCYPILDELYDFLDENGGIVIEIGGHTNSTPPDEFCDRLSTARAKSAADYLIAKGIAPQRVAYKGYGKRKPIATNATPEGRKINQRVEIKILRIDKG